MLPLVWLSASWISVPHFEKGLAHQLGWVWIRQGKLREKVQGFSDVLQSELLRASAILGSGVKNLDGLAARHLCSSTLLHLYFFIQQWVTSFI